MVVGSFNKKKKSLIKNKNGHVVVIMPIFDVGDGERKWKIEWVRSIIDRVL